MDKIKITCRHCATVLVCEESDRGRKVKCPHCKKRVPVPQFSPIEKALRQARHRAAQKKFLAVAAGVMLALVAAMLGTWIFQPVIVRWPDRRPVGELFLASNLYASPTNPRGWFNDSNLDVTGKGGTERFRAALVDYADRSIAILKRTGAQGVIVWDLEGEQYPHKTTYIGDPRLLERLAPEMDAAADEFFARLRHAGFKVGLTVRPQQLDFDYGQPHQAQVLNVRQTLLEKIDYARKRWGATIFYVDSTGGIRRPDEVWQLRSVAKARPDILLIPEHHYLPYWASTTPYIPLRRDDGGRAADWARKFFRGAFAAVDVSDAADDANKILRAHDRGDLLLFRAWSWSPECQLLESLASAPAAR